jgi:perosamine synthetase
LTARLPLIDVAKPFVGLRERLAVDRVLRSRSLAQGREVEDFEKEFSIALVNNRATVAVNSGTSGQHLGLVAAGVGPGDEVIVPSFTFAATANSVALTGATPVFCDINPETFCIDPQRVSDLLSPKTKGIMPVHMFGHPADMEQIGVIAKKKGIEIFEDAAQAHGAEVSGRQVGTFGLFGMFSLYPTKNMTSGEGGMVSCRDDSFARQVRLLRNQGMDVRYQNEVVGYNNRMTDIHAAIGRVQLARLQKWTEKRRQNADFLTKNIQSISLPVEKPGIKHVYHQYTVRITEDRDGFASALLSEFGISTGVYYPKPLHHLPSLDKYPLRQPLDETEKATREVLSLPVHPQLRGSHLERIVIAVNKLARAGA